MKVLEQTPNQLILQNRPTGFWLLGNSFIIIGIGIIIFLSEALTLICHRESATEGHCKQTYSFPLYYSQTDTFKIPELPNIKIFKESHSKWINNYPSPLRVKNFLNNPQQRDLVIKQSNYWITYSLGGVLIIIGFLTKLGYTITVTFDKTQQLLIMDRRRISRVQTIQSLANITAVKISNYFWLSQILLIMKSGEQIPITSPSLNTQNKQQIANKIIDFLDETIQLIKF